MKIKYTIPVMVSTAVLLASCGGGGSTTTTTSPPDTDTNYKLTGTVPGTLIEAFCDDGSYHSVNSESNSTNKHPFTLQLPKGLSCRLVMTTNENDLANKVVTPIKFVNSSGVSSIAFSANKDINLNYIELPMSRSEMHSDANQDGVEDTPKEITLDKTVSSNIKIIISGIDPLDSDSDGIINIFEDTDGDGINNHDDEDDDNDGILDINDDDRNNDGTPDYDHDGDGIPDSHDQDDDNDGINDADDLDDDNDGIDDVNEIKNNQQDDDENRSDEDHSNDENNDDDDRDSHNDGTNNDNTGGNTNPSTPSDPIITTATAGRLLASQCAQCHGTDGASVTGIDSLDGESRNEIIKEMLEMQAKNKNKLMHLQAKGYNREQIGLIADYFSGVTSGSGNSNNEEEDD